MINRKWIFLALFLVLAFSSTALAFGQPMGRRDMPEKRIGKLVKELGLTDQQKDNFLAQTKQVEEAAKASFAANKELFGKIQSELQKDSPDSQAIHNHILQINKNRAEIEFKRMEQIIQLRWELTPEQKTKFDSLMKEKKEKAREQWLGKGKEKREAK
jgi:Spy/CpxP family protein refolding chaperone